ncbi:MAG: hypothetical protein AAFQ79_17845 [Pseudomonadota bacterium]
MFDYIAFGALIRRKRGEMGLTQPALAKRVFGKAERKADISRFEAGKKKPQEDTVQKLCLHLDISDAEIEPIRKARPLSETLGEIPTLSREELQNLASRFGIEDPFDAPDGELRRQLTLKADEYRDLKKQVDSIDPKMQRLSNLKAAAQDALARGDFDEVDEVLESVHEVELEEAARTAELRAETMLLRGRVEEAYRILSATADSFASVDPLEPARRRILKYWHTLRDHGLRYGGEATVRSREFLEPILTSGLRNQDRWLWAAGQNALAISFREQGTRTAGEDGAELLAQAVAAYRYALRVYSESALPMEWAMTQNNIGTALANQGMRTVGENAAALLAQAIAAFRAALRVYTEDAHPMEWATTQNNLGNALRNQGTRAAAEDSVAPFAMAVAAYRAALRVYSKDRHPMDWAMTQNNLGTALQNQSTRTAGEDEAALLAQAVAAYRAALCVYSADAHPVQWAITQNNLGAALFGQGKCTPGEDGAPLFAEAVNAYRVALRVRTADAQPVQWAMTQENLALAHEAIAYRPTTTDPRLPLETALAHAEAALKVFDPEHMSYNHTKATTLRDRIQARLDAL